MQRRRRDHPPDEPEVDPSRCHWAVVGCVNPATLTVNGLRVCEEHTNAALALWGVLDNRPDDGA